MTTDIRTEARRIVALLSDPARAEDSRVFPTDRAAADRPGLYSWWADGAAQSLFERVQGVSVGSLIYAGQAGAKLSSAKSPKSPCYRE